MRPLPLMGDCLKEDVCKSSSEPVRRASGMKSTSAWLAVLLAGLNHVRHPALT